MKIRYVGPHESVVVAMPGGQESEPVVRGGLFETRAEHARVLLEQPSNWKPTKKPPAKTPAATKEKE